MNTRTGLLVAIAFAALFLAGTAGAHPKHQSDVSHRHYVERYGHVHAPVRARHMPRWLRHDRHFRRWYRHSSIRHNPYLPWWKVHRVYERHLYRDGYPYARDRHRSRRSRG